MRLGYLISQYPAASHTFIRREIDELRSRGCDIQTFSIRRPPPGEYAAERDRSAFAETFYLLPVGAITVLTAHLDALRNRPAAYFRVALIAIKHRAPGLRALLWALFHFTEAIVLAKELQRRQIQHVHNHFANAGANVGLLATRFLSLPWSLTLHGVSETDYPAGLLLGQKIEAAQFVACVSHFGRAQAMRQTIPSHWHKLFIVRCGLQLSALPERVLPKSNALPRIVCVGRLSREKGQLGLIEAFAMLQAQGIDAELVLVGDGPERSLIEQRICTLACGDRVAMKGRLDEEHALLEIARSDLLVLPSFMEGLPIVLMEAMALGVPVVAAQVAGIPELISDEKVGLLFRPADWNDLAEKIKRLLTDAGLRNRLSVAARQRVESEFEIGRAVGPLISLFQGSGPHQRRTGLGFGDELSH